MEHSKPRSKIFLTIKLTCFTVMEIRNLAKPLCVIVFFLKTVFTFKNYALTHNNKMGLLKGSIEDSFWLDALCAFVFTINRLPAPILYDKFPHEVLFAKVTNYNF